MLLKSAGTFLRDLMLGDTLRPADARCEASQVGGASPLGALGS